MANYPLSGRIHRLTEEVFNQIAAGEVVERPASVVKELVENSLDAGATHITISLKHSGKVLIQIIDNGQGIHPDDLSLSIAPHATSKISVLQDLQSLASLGFRGEALASIASVSKFRIRSKQKNADKAYEISHEEKVPSPIAHDEGTTVSVEELFYNVPVRRRFLRSDRTEFLHIETLVKALALSHPSVGFSLYHEGELVLQLPALDNAMDVSLRIAKILPRDFIKTALSINVARSDFELNGFVSALNKTYPHTEYQYLFLNGRLLKDKLLYRAIRAAYDNIRPGAYPAFVLYLTAPPNLFDVNIHPTKYEVRFEEPRLIHDFLFTSLKKLLATDGVTPAQAGKNSQESEFLTMPKALVFSDGENASSGCASTIHQTFFNRYQIINNKGHYFLTDLPLRKRVEITEESFEQWFSLLQ
jgi:DNA mismatch repair protein MutL